MTRRVGPFELEAKLGQGGMGVVYRAVGPDGPAAVKLIRGMDISPSALGRFRREAKIRIDHPNIIRVLDAGVSDEGTSYIAFELLEGETLDVRLQRGTTSPREAIEIGIEASRGLVAAHAVGVIHRDLKPSNLFLLKGGGLKILDFGVAYLESHETRMTRTGSVLGTPAYLSPEQARGHSTIDARADVWALGAVLYESLAGKPPFVRDTPLAVLVALVMDPLTPIKSLVPGLPSSLVQVIDRALRKDRAGRWPTAAAMLAALETARTAVASGADHSATLVDQEAPTLNPSLAEPEKRVVSVVLAASVRNLTELRRAIEKNRGLLFPLVGNRAVGVFGAEKWEGDEPRRAVSAALAARSAAQIMSLASGRGTRSREGISGLVLSSAEAGLSHLPRGIVADSETALLVQGRYRTRALADGYVELKRPMPGSLFPTLITKIDEPLIGRQMEMGQLEMAINTAFEDERSLVVALSGPAGIGKSAVGRAAERVIGKRHPAPLLLTSRAEFRSQVRPFGLICDALRAHLSSVALGKGHNETGDESLQEDTEARTRAALHGLVGDALGASNEDANTVEEFLVDLLELDRSDNDTVAESSIGDAGLLADRVRLSVVDVITGLCSQRPVALVVDLHQADSQSIELLDELLERQQDRAFLVVAETRPEVWESLPTLFSGANLVRIELRGLQRRDVGRMIKAQLGADPGEAMVRKITQRTSGNPLFIEQLVAAIAARGDSSPLPDELPLPLSVEAAVQSRLDHLPAAEKEILKELALVGIPITADFLAELGLLDAGPLLTSLSRRDLITSQRDAGDQRHYWFRSALVAEVAYRLIADELRSGLHARVAACMQRQRNADPEILGRHLEAAGSMQRAAEQYAEACLRSGRRGDSPGVLHWSDKAFTLGDMAERAFDLRMARAVACGFSGQTQQRAEELRAAHACARTDAERAQSLTWQAIGLHRAGQVEESLDVAREAVAAARRAGEPGSLGLALGWHSVSLAYAGHIDEAISHLDEACQLMSERAEDQALAAEWRAQVHGVRGDLGARQTAFEDAARYYGETGHVRKQVGAECNLADVYNRVGDYARAESALSAAIDGCRRVNHRLMEGYALCNRGYSLAKLSRNDDALESLRAAEAIAQSVGDMRLASVVVGYRARVRLTSDFDYEAIAAEAAEGARAAEEAGMPSFAAVALGLAGEAKLRAGLAGEALDYSSKAMAIRDSMGGLEEDEGEVFLTHVRALRAAGRESEAEEARLQAEQRLRQIASHISDPLVREQFLNGIPEHRALLTGILDSATAG